MVDLERLDQYLNSDGAPAEAMGLSDLDGFLTGVLCSPELIMPSEWLPFVWGQVRPDIKDIDEHQWATKEILARYNEVAIGLNDDPSKLEPVFWKTPEGHAIAMDWCEGFHEAMQLRPEPWKPLIEEDESLSWLYPILAHLLDSDGVSMSGVSEEELDEVLDDCARRIPQVVPVIFLHNRSSNRAEHSTDNVDPIQ